MNDRVNVRKSDAGLIVEQIIDGQVRVRICVWRELREDIPFWHGFRGIFGPEPLRDEKGLRPAGRGGDIVDRLEDFQEHSASTLGKFLVWAVPE